MSVEEFLRKNFRVVECRDCKAECVWIPPKMKDGKSKLFSVNGDAHWMSCSSESAKAFRKKIADQGGTKRPDRATDNQDVPY